MQDTDRGALAHMPAGVKSRLDALRALGVDTETAAESVMDRLDRDYLRGRMSEREYDAACRGIDAWCRR